MFQSNGALSESYDNFMPAAYLRFQIRNLTHSTPLAILVSTLILPNY